MSSYYRYNESGNLVSCGDTGFCPSIRPGETDVEISRELAAEINANGLAAYTHAILSARPAPIPESVSPLQAEMALEHFGYLANVEYVIEAFGADASRAWRRAAVIRSDSPLLNAIVDTIPGLRDDLPDIMRYAAKIEV